MPTKVLTALARCANRSACETVVRNWGLASPVQNRAGGGDAGGCAMGQAVVMLVVRGKWATLHCRPHPVHTYCGYGTNGVTRTHFTLPLPLRPAFRAFRSHCLTQRQAGGVDLTDCCPSLDLSLRPHSIVPDCTCTCTGFSAMRRCLKTLARPDAHLPALHLDDAPLHVQNGTSRSVRLRRLNWLR